jgi:PKD repeat protein
MNKFRATYCGAFILGWVLAFGSQTAWGYYPPLQATAEYDAHSVEYTVYNPEKKQGYVASHDYPPTITVVNLQQHNGVIAWVLQDGTSYSVNCVTFDPALNTFKNDWWGPFAAVSHFRVADGVVAFSFIDSSGNVGARYATYDPAKGAWQKGVFLETGAWSLDVITEDGVVVYRFWGPLGGDEFRATLYEPQWGKWSSPLYFGTSSKFEFLYISNATIYYRSEGFDPDLLGYALGGWGHSPTAPFAYFVAQPKLGGSPLWVWFTDMSIAGANWSWDFGGPFLVIDRSPYHKFNAPGSYQVTLWISGSSSYTQTIILGYPSTLKGESLPGILYLLLAD